ncbi:hypothetical protein FDP41_007579 [Naegleria fowleri]|uniref:Carbohydrate kinase PfkB domain-containing protein n=1 Tax=Naegleria fowleri TaxID=5763 RepID=A0A6A5CAS9_NAEFO|nr:uncharacterized protein FDP41_007579 [Naegleria fowleri]KAF0983664.1 hypothetical protein FDP41_007579 [Naegleria fowleri]
MEPFTIHYLGVMTMDYLAIVDEYPIPNSKNRTRSMEMHGGGNAANVVFDLIRMMIPPLTAAVKNQEQQLTIHDDPNNTDMIMIKIGTDVVGKAIYEEFAKLCSDVKHTPIELNLNSIVRSPFAQSSFSYIMITPNKQQGNDRTIINTPLSEEFSFDELSQQQQHGPSSKIIDILFIDGRYSSVAVSYVNTHKPKCVIMECERMRPIPELNTFLELMTLSHILLLSENFPIEYLNHITHNSDVHDSSLKRWIENSISHDGYDARLISMHILFSKLSGSIGMIPYKEEYSGVTKSIKTIEQLIQDSDHVISTSSHQSDVYPQTVLSTFSFEGPKSEKFDYVIIYCPSYQDPQFPTIVDTTGAGDSFNASVIYCLSRLLIGEEETNFTIHELSKSLKFSNIAAFYTCTGVGARATGIDHEKAEKLWNELDDKLLAFLVCIPWLETGMRDVLFLYDCSTSIDKVKESLLNRLATFSDMLGSDDLLSIYGENGAPFITSISYITRLNYVKFFRSSTSKRKKLFPPLKNKLATNANQ